MGCIKESSNIKSKFFYYLFDFLIVFFSIEGKSVEKYNCPLIECNEKPSHKPQRYQSNAQLQVTPKIEIPLDLNESVGTGFKIALPIKIKFQSQVQLMSDWVKQFLSSKTKHLTKNFNSFSASLTQLLALLKLSANAGSNPSEQHSGHSDIGTHPDAATSHSVDNINYNSNSSATHSSKSNLSVGYSKRKDNHRLMLQSQFANDTRAQARNLLFKSIEISHSSLGKSCLLRAICEVSQTPLMAPKTGLFGELLDMFLTINSFHESLNDLEDYMNAQTVGHNSFVKQSENGLQNYSFVDECRVYYGAVCPFSLFNINNNIPNE